MKKQQRFLNPYFIVKTSGGVASQLLGLISAIQISNEINRPFKVKHYPYSTGGFYPIAIKELLSHNEIHDLNAQIPGMDTYGRANVGAILESHPLIAKKFSYMHLLNMLNRIGFGKLLNLLRLEWQVNTSEKRLLAAPRFLNSISGGYPPFYSSMIEEDLRIRFMNAGRKWPFAGDETSKTNPDVVIHFRLGDKRTAYSKPGLGGAVNAIIDPICFKEILDLVPNENRGIIYVISDEPKTALSLLANVGINAIPSSSNGDIWKDIELMSSGKILICPWSSVSQLIATFVSQLANKRIFYPKSPGKDERVRWKLNNVEYYEPKYLAKDHPIYVQEYSSAMENGVSYLETDQ